MHPGMQALEYASDQEEVHALFYRFLLRSPECSYLDFSTGGVVAAVNMVLCFGGGLANVAHCGWIFLRGY